MKKLTQKVFQLSLTASLLAACSPAVAQFIPGGPSSVGSANVVPDVPIWYDGVSIHPGAKLGPIVGLTNQIADFNNWEPWVSVIGEKVFVVECNKFADDSLNASERYVLAFQPARPGTWADAKLGNCFYDDAGNPYTNMISSRQDGNPGRVYGDRRYDGVNLATAAESDPQDYPTYFTRFTDPVYNVIGGQRPALAECFSLNLSTLVQTPLCKAFAGETLGRPDLLSNTGVTDTQWGRQGGGLAALDNGNFVFLFNDRSSMYLPDGNSGNEAVACIFTPTGGVAKAAWLVATNAGNNQAWTDPCGFKGGFCVRYGVGTAYGPNDAWLGFHDNAGNLVATNMHNTASGVVLDTGRGDGTKIAGDIRTPWVYYTSAGWLTVWNGTNGAYLAKYHVIDDLDPTATVDRSDVACDSAGNVCVAWNGRPTTAIGLGTNTDQSFTQDQILCRVLHFDGVSTVTAVTHTFFPFVNSDTDTNNIVGFKTTNPNLDMTTRFICIAAKGLINSTNNVAGGPDSQPQTTVYTVISNPGYVPAKLKATLSGSNLIISWAASAGDGTLQSSPTVQPTAWSNVSPQPASVLVNGDTYQKTVAIGAGNLYFRLSSP